MGFNLGLYYLAGTEGHSVAQIEKTKFETELHRIAPHLTVEVSVRPAMSPLPGHGGYPNQQPPSGAESLLITELPPGLGYCDGFGGPKSGWLNIQSLVSKGAYSVHIVVHEWLHTIWKSHQIDIDHAGEKYGFVAAGSTWKNTAGQEFNEFVLKNVK